MVVENTSEGDEEQEWDRGGSQPVRAVDSRSENQRLNIDTFEQRVRLSMPMRPRHSSEAQRRRCEIGVARNGDLDGNGRRSDNISRAAKSNHHYPQEYPRPSRPTHRDVPTTTSARPSVSMNDIEHPSHSHDDYKYNNNMSNNNNMQPTAKSATKSMRKRGEAEK